MERLKKGFCYEPWTTSGLSLFEGQCQASVSFLLAKLKHNKLVISIGHFKGLVTKGKHSCSIVIQTAAFDYAKIVKQK